MILENDLAQYFLSFLACVISLKLMSHKIISGVNTGGGSRGQSAPPWQQKTANNLEKEGENQKKNGKRGKKLGKKKNQEDSFTLPLLTGRAGHATENNEV